MKPTLFNEVLYSLMIAAGVTLPPLAKAADPPRHKGIDAGSRSSEIDGREGTGRDRDAAPIEPSLRPTGAQKQRSA